MQNGWKQQENTIQIKSAANHRNPQDRSKHYLCASKKTTPKSSEIIITANIQS